MSDRCDTGGRLLDLEKLRLRFDGDDELLGEIFTVFLEEAPERREGILAALATGDLPRLTHLAHSLKGVAGTIFAEPLRQAAYELELAARTGDLDRSRLLSDPVLKLLALTASCLPSRP